MVAKFGNDNNTGNGMVKKIYLLRHGKSDHPNNVEDHDRPLNVKGKEQAVKMAGYITRAWEAPQIVLCSEAKRTRQTWQVMQPAFPQDITAHFLKQLYLATPGEILHEISKLGEGVSSVMVIAHNPGIHQLSVLLTGHVADENSYGRMRLKFPTCGLAVLSTTIATWKELEPGFCTLERFVVPKDL